MGVLRPPPAFHRVVKPNDLRGILRYVPRFRDKIFVVAVDGAIVTDDNFPNLVLDLAVLRSLNIRITLVHGAAEQIRLLALERGLTPSNLDGTGVTDASTLQLALTAANRLTHEILEGLAACDLRAAATNAIVAHPTGILGGVDHQFTGKVERIDVEFLQGLLAQGIIPIAPPLGFDGDGRTFRVNSDSVAAQLAEQLKAAKLIYVGSGDGLIRNGSLLRQVAVGELRQWLAQPGMEAASPDMLSKARCAVAACEAGVPRAHIINGRTDNGLLTEVFSNEGIGTMVHANEYQQIRRALKKDIRSLLLLTRNSVAAEELVRRTRSDIERRIGDYFLFEIDRNPVGCVALHVYPERNQGELAFLFVLPSHENQGIGFKLVKFIEDKARELGLAELFTLSTQAFTWFQQKAGFAEGAPDDLPPARRERYEASGRKSKVLIKRLRPPTV